ncbi:MAG: response regulator [Chitinophagaceae bacterium]|jgi:DNA-binding NarL/FixJ family response regulator
MVTSQPNMPIHIAIAEDNSFVRKATLQRLEPHPQIVVKYLANNGEELLQQLQKDARIDLVLMDLQMPIMNGIETTLQVKKLYPQIKVLVLTMFDDDEHLFNAIMAGASGYILKEDNSNQLFQSIMDTVTGGAAMSAGIALKTLNLIRNPLQPDIEINDYGLSKREIELLTQLKNGLTYEQIAANLFISYHTVRKHIENIYRKLHVNNKVDALHKASQNRLV